MKRLAGIRAIGISLLMFGGIFIVFYGKYGGCVGQWLFGFTVASIFIILGFGILRLKNWARLIYVWCATLLGMIFFFNSPLAIESGGWVFISIMTLSLLFGLSALFLTRSAVKKQFK